MSPTRRRIEVEGVVQGVGFRPWVYRLARSEGLGGSVRNDAAGVTIEAFGQPARLDTFVEELREAPPPAAVRSVSWRDIDAPESQNSAPYDESAFVIVASDAGGDRRLSIPPDLATCDACLADVTNPDNRRYRYPFTNCTHCGPRYTIAVDVPYDRPATTMAAFEMCTECRREYDDPVDRRFHAQPNACPRCGPRLQLLSTSGEPIDTPDPLLEAASRLRHGEILAVKGLGGFHLACDAESTTVVNRLRARKRRDQKPFAVMVAGVDEARRIADLKVEEELLLTAVERPIVLARRRPKVRVSEAVAPNSDLIGLMLPYTPLHHLLLAEYGGALVMTSGNLSDEPIVYRNREAVERLSGLADSLLVHDRPISGPCDDSVARVIAGGPVLLRRSRGYTPRPIELPRCFEQPVLACGGDLKNTFCIGVGASAYLGPHIGDLETIEAYEGLDESIQRMQRYLGVEPQIVAFDLHPRYLSSRYARRHPAAVKIAVQHHHAHLVSAAIEHRLDGPVLGVIYDGTGFGTDDTAWGGEILRGDEHGFERLATLRSIRLPGSDRAIREVWRIALALLEDSYETQAPIEQLAVFDRVPATKIEQIRRLLESNIQCPRSRGIGRYFDAIGSLALERTDSAFEGQVAMEWNQAALVGETGIYPWTLDDSRTPAEIDLRPLVRAVVDDILGRTPPGLISARFHNTLVEATAATLERLAMDTRSAVVLSGGCFQNPLLAERLIDRLGGFDVRLQRQVPPGDGGLALGQAAIADARLKNGSSRMNGGQS